MQQNRQFSCVGMPLFQLLALCHISYDARPFLAAPLLCLGRARTMTARRITP